MTMFDRVRDAFGVGVSKEVATLSKALRAGSIRQASGAGNPESKLALMPLAAQLVRLVGHTPQKVSAAVRAADSGNPAALIEILQDLRSKDGHIQGTLEKREGSVTKLAWELYYPDQDPKSKKGARQIRFATEAIQGIPNFADALEHINGAVVPGFSVTEIGWAKREGKIIPAELHRHNARRFGFRRADQRLVLNDLTTLEFDFRAAFPDCFIVHQPRVTGDLPAREGLIRVLVWAGLFRNWSLSDWLKLGELSWKPWRTGKYSKEKSSDEDVDTLYEILVGMNADGCAVHPDTVELDIHWPSGQTPSRASHSELFDVVGREISKAVLGNTLTTEGGKVGTQALAEVHERGENDKDKKDARNVGELLTRQLVTPLIRLNFGESTRVPHFRLLVEERQDLEKLGKGVKDLVAAKVPIPVSWILSEAGIPEPKPDEAIVGGESVTDDTTNEDAPADEPSKDDAKAEDKPADKKPAK